METHRFGDRPFQPREFVIPILIVLAVLFVGLLSFGSFYTVKANEEAVVLRFGRFLDTTGPGLHFKIPLVDRALKVSVEEHSLRLPLGIETERNSFGAEDEEETLMLTADFNAASVEWSVQWKISDPYIYLFSFYHPDDPKYIEKVIRTAARTVMNRLVGDYSLDEVLTEKRSTIAVEARRQTQIILDEFKRGKELQGCGVVITGLQMQRVTPPSTVKPAYDAVLAAIQKSRQLENEANKERNQLLPAANAASDKIKQEAEGYAARRRAEVNGEINALINKFEAYENAPDVTRQRLYLEAMQEILEGVETKIVIDSELRQVLPLLQLGSGAVK